MHVISFFPVVATVLIGAGPVRGEVSGGLADPEQERIAAEGFALSGVAPGDLARTWSGEGLPAPARMASDPLHIPAEAALLIADLSAEDPGAILRKAWTELGVDADVEPRSDPGPLADHLTSRRDRTAVRQLGPDLRALVEVVVAEAHEARARGGAVDSRNAQGQTAAISLRLLTAVVDASGDLDASSWPTTPAVLSTDVGRILLGTTGTDVFEAPFLAVLDPGGDDLYLGDGADQPLTALLDLGGSDTYRDLPSASGGVAVLLDRSGDDTYRGGPMTLGAAEWGCSVLVDREGHDSYSAASWGLGAALWGVGLLLDGTGDDVYRSGAASQGAGGPGGFGALIDRQGADVYLSEAPEGGVQGHGMGMGPSHPGGVGVLLDRSGDDTYRAVTRAQGHATWRGLGLAVDEGGDDVWVSGSWSQGSASHQGVGTLIDVGGDDRYAATRRAQGFGHDLAVGLLVDGAGNDRYLGDSMVQGTASGNGLGWMLDGAGDDSFTALDVEARWGHARPLRGEESIALRLDVGGADAYGPLFPAGDATAGAASRHGIHLDLPSGPSPPMAAATPCPVDPPATLPMAPVLLDEAERWLSEPVAADRAVSRLTGLGPAIYPMMRQRLGDARPATAAAMTRVLRSIAAADPLWQRALLAQVLTELREGAGGEEAAILVHWAGLLAEGEPDATVLLSYLGHSSAATRRAAAGVLGAVCEDPPTSEALTAALAGDPDAGVRSAAARALGGCGSAAAVAPLATALRAQPLPVRDAASRSLVLLARDGHAAEVTAAVRAPAVAGDIAALEVLARIPDSGAVPSLTPLLDADQPSVRGAAALALGAVGSSTARKALMGRESIEAHPYVLWCLDRALRTPGNPPAIVPDLQ